jgi:hypothetical protein
MFRTKASKTLQIAYKDYSVVSKGLHYSSIGISGCGLLDLALVDLDLGLLGRSDGLRMSSALVYVLRLACSESDIV